MISLAKLNDAPDIVSIVNEAIKKAQPFRKEGLLRITQEKVEETILNRTNRRWYLLKKVTVVVATLLFRQDSALEGSIHMFSTKPSEQGQGIGAKLLEYVEKEERVVRISLWCEKIPGLIGYYSRHGYRTTGEQMFYHSDYLKPESVGKITIVKMQKERKCLKT